MQERGTYEAGAKYNECMLMSGVATAALALGGMTALGVGLYFSLTRWLLTATVLPSPGQGPSEVRQAPLRARGFMQTRMLQTNRRQLVQHSLWERCPLSRPP